MHRIWKSYQTENKEDFRNQLLTYTAQFNEFIFLDSCDNTVYGKNEFDFLLAAGNYKNIQCNAGNTFDALKEFINENNDWCFGYFGYDLKNEIEDINSNNKDEIGFEDMLFFIPEAIIICEDSEIKIGIIDNNADKIFSTILNIPPKLLPFQGKKEGIPLTARVSKQNYLQKIKQLQQHIIEGNVYEINLCQEFYAEEVEINPLKVFDALCKRSKAPFSVLFKWEEKFLISASPERFLKKEGNRITSSPMKGTIKRGNTKDEDEYLKNELSQSLKDKAENVMIVDLVRNDLTKSARTGTIKIDELFAVYSFEHVHQMVSTVSAEVRNDLHVVDIIKNAFPMGSMTGAPKVMAMELIERYEETKRGVYSGAFGYFTPEKDFDFNVVIRSIIYNSEKRYVSAQVGGAIVYDSDPEEEYEECLVKLRALIDVLNVHADRTD
ncbi:MAG: anthranilate synthase component I family protein [Fimbriimonadaceae bacterium]|nr:anthranilate synthase component I family protein [Chitinophagales bacterium]